MQNADNRPQRLARKLQPPEPIRQHEPPREVPVRQDRFRILNHEFHGDSIISVNSMGSNGQYWQYWSVLAVLVSIGSIGQYWQYWSVYSVLISKFSTCPRVPGITARCSLLVTRWSLVVGRWSLVVGRCSPSRPRLPPCELERFLTTTTQRHEEHLIT